MVLPSFMVQLRLRCGLQKVVPKLRVRVSFSSIRTFALILGANVMTLYNITSALSNDVNKLSHISH